MNNSAIDTQAWIYYVAYSYTNEHLQYSMNNHKWMSELASLVLSCLWLSPVSSIKIYRDNHVQYISITGIVAAGAILYPLASVHGLSVVTSQVQRCRERKLFLAQVKWYLLYLYVTTALTHKQAYIIIIIYISTTYTHTWIDINIPIPAHVCKFLSNKEHTVRHL